MVPAVTTTTASSLDDEPALPDTIHSCPACSHWLAEGTLACPDCQALTYGRYLSAVAQSAQQLEQERKWPEARRRWQSALAWLPAETQQAANVRQHITDIDLRLKAADDQKDRWRKRLGPFAPVALFLLKIKSFFFILFKIKFLFGFLAFFGLYWVAFGWKFAAGFMAGLAIHEMGHYVAVRRRGFKADLPMFIPGVMAYVRWYSQGATLEDLAAIALAGPLYGLTVSLAFLAAWIAWHSRLLVVLANVTAWINFVNLLPLIWMDGARATYAMSRMQRALVAATCLLFFGLTISGGDIMGPSTQWIFLIVGLGMVWRCFTNDEPEKPSTAIFVYFQALVLVLGLVVLYTYPRTILPAAM